jgi:hypothetical protein
MGIFRVEAYPIVLNFQPYLADVCILCDSDPFCLAVLNDIFGLFLDDPEQGDLFALTHFLQNADLTMREFNLVKVAEPKVTDQILYTGNQAPFF